jgi:hypothetical protein
MRDIKEIARRVFAALNDPAPKIWWWLSFCDPAKPKGSQFLGVAIVEGNNILTAAIEARRLGCNPGGEVMGEPFEDNEILPAERFRNCLLNDAEIAECESAKEEQARSMLQ